MKIQTDDFDIKECTFVIQDTESAMTLIAEFEALSTIVDMLSLRMKAELHSKLLKGKKGWESPETHPDLSIEKGLYGAFYRKDWVTVANYAAILWNRQDSDD